MVAHQGRAGPRPRLRVEHAQILAPADIPRFARLGVVPSMQPTHCTSDMRWAGERLGPDRLAGAYGIGRRMDKRVQALITDMSQPLGYAIGNALEVMEVSQTLQSAGPNDLTRLSLELAARMTQGAASMVLQTGRHPAALKDDVTTPAGCTIDGILELEEGRLRVTLIRAVVKAAHRAKELLYK